jgi:hypothetical protein
MLTQVNVAHRFPFYLPVNLRFRLKPGSNGEKQFTEE